MVVICLGPCCIPLHALLPFLVGMAHQRGYLKWVRKEWFTWRWLAPRARRALWMKVSDEELARTAIKTMEPAKKAASRRLVRDSGAASSRSVCSLHQ